MPDTMGKILGHSVDTRTYRSDVDLVLSRCIIGVEVEIEGMPNELVQTIGHAKSIAKIPYLSYDSHTGETLFGNGLWSVKHDGSLRNNGIEFITKKLFGADLLNALNELHEFLNSKDIQKTASISDRCSIHVHMDIRNLKPNEFIRLLLDYAIFEKILFKYCGEERERNLYCLPYAHSDAFRKTLSDLYSLQNEDFKYILKGFQKYSALNIGAAYRLGSIEFRQYPGTLNINGLKDWINILMCLKKFAKGRSPINLHKDISKIGTQNYLEYVFEKYSKLLQYTGYEYDVLNGVRIAQEILIYQTIQESSNLYFKTHNSLRDFTVETYKPPKSLLRYLTKLKKTTARKGELLSYLQLLQEGKTQIKRNGARGRASVPNRGLRGVRLDAGDTIVIDRLVDDL